MTADGTLAAEATRRPVSFRLKGGLFPLTLLDITRYSRQAFEEDLKSKVAEAPAFFQQTPVVLSLEFFEEELQAPALSELCQLCRQYGLIPIALRGGREDIQQQALAQGLALMAESRNKASAADKASLPTLAATEKNDSRKMAAKPQQTCLALEVDSGLAETNETHHNSPAGESPEAIAHIPQPTADANGKHADGTNAREQPKIHGSKIVTTPIRSGQQVYAAGGDLIVMAAVSAGAEVLADGNIHVYGALRGRALAGVRGDTAARVFCHSLEAELISIAGHFKLDEDLQSGHWKQPVQIHLDDQALRIEPLLSRSLTSDN